MRLIQTWLRPVFRASAAWLNPRWRRHAASGVTPSSRIRFSTSPGMVPSPATAIASLSAAVDCCGFWPICRPPRSSADPPGATLLSWQTPHDMNARGRTPATRSGYIHQRTSRSDGLSITEAGKGPAPRPFSPTAHFRILTQRRKGATTPRIRKRPVAPPYSECSKDRFV